MFRCIEPFHRWLVNHRWLGTYIRNHYEGRGMRRRDKIVTLVALWAGIGATAIWSVDALWIRLVLLACERAEADGHALRVVAGDGAAGRLIGILGLVERLGVDGSAG